MEDIDSLIELENAFNKINGLDTKNIKKIVFSYLKPVHFLPQNNPLIYPDYSIFHNENMAILIRLQWFRESLTTTLQYKLVKLDDRWIPILFTTLPIYINMGMILFDHVKLGNGLVDKNGYCETDAKFVRMIILEKILDKIRQKEFMVVSRKPYYLFSKQLVQDFEKGLKSQSLLPDYYFVRFE